MRCSSPATVLSAVAVLLTGCGGPISSTASYNPGYGPFDEEGNYVEEWADKPARKHWWSRTKTKPRDTAVAKKATPPDRASTASRSTASRPATPPRVASTTPVSKPKPKPKPESEPVKAEPKKPAPIRHKVTKGDTLWALSRRYGAPVSSIKRANGLSGTTIRIGQTLLIPR